MGWEIAAGGFAIAVLGLGLWRSVRPGTWPWQGLRPPAWPIIAAAAFAAGVAFGPALQLALMRSSIGDDPQDPAGQILRGMIGFACHGL